MSFVGTRLVYKKKNHPKESQSSTCLSYGMYRSVRGCGGQLGGVPGAFLMKVMSALLSCCGYGKLMR